MRKAKGILAARRSSKSSRVFLLLCLAFFAGGGAAHALPAAGFLFSEDTIALEAGFTTMYGQVRQHVYTRYDYLLSRLDWDVKPLLGLGVGGAYKLKTCTLSLGLAIALPGRCGLIQDYDWAESDEDGDYFYNGVWSHYSSHPSFIKNAFRIDFDVLFNWTSGPRWRLDYILGITWQHFSFYATDGFYQYPPTSEPRELSGLVVSYDTDQITPVFGLMYSARIGGGAVWSSVLKFGLIGFGYSYDQHHLRELDFMDYYWLQPYVEVRQALALDFGNRFGSELSLFFILYPKTYGYSFVRDLEDNQLYKLMSSGWARSIFIGGELRIQFTFKKQTPDLSVYEL